MIGAKELFQEMREQEISCQPSLQEMEFASSRTYCSNCQRNWSSLPTMEGEGEEEYDYCPQCRSDAHLQEGRPGDSFSIRPLTGELYNDTTGQLATDHQGAPPQVTSDPKPFDKVKYQLRKDRAESLDDRALDAYQKAYETGGKEAGERAYFAELKKQHQ